MVNKTQIAIAIITILLLISVGYIVFEKSSEYLKGERLLYYQSGYQEGASYWNNKVIETAREEDSLVYVFNQTEYKVTFKQLCEEK